MGCANSNIAMGNEECKKILETILDIRWIGSGKTKKAIFSFFFHRANLCIRNHLFIHLSILPFCVSHCVEKKEYKTHIHRMCATEIEEMETRGNRKKK